MRKYFFIPIILIFLLESCSKKEPFMKVGLVADP